MIQATLKVTDKKTMFDAMYAHINQLDGLVITTGIHKEDSHKTYEDGETLGVVAMKNEFGLGVPERSFLRETFDRRNRAWFSLMRRTIHDNILRASLYSSVSREMRKVTRRDIQSRIEHMRYPRNAASTISKKGFDNPLIHTRRLLKNIKAKAGKRL